MPPISNSTDDIEEMDSSTIENPGEVTDADPPAGGEAEGAASAESSTAQTDDTEAGLLSVVRDVVSERPAAAASSAEGAEAGQGAGGAPTTEPDNETFSDVPFHKHPRFQALVGQRNAYREDAVRYGNITSYLEQNNLSSEEAANALATFARAKYDPAGAFAELKPWLQNLLIAAGEVLPDDLKARVERNEISADVAFELSRERARSKSHETRQGFEAQRQERQTQVNLRTELGSAVTEWEADRKVKDPNFEAKYPMLEREVAYLQQKEGKPNTKDGVIAQLKKAYEAVNKAFKPAAPTPQQGGRKPPVAPVTSGQANNGAAPSKKPQTTLDIVRANRRKAG